MEKNGELKNKVFPDTPDADDSKNKKDEQDNNKADNSSSDKKLSKDENTVASQEENGKEDAKDKKSEVNEDKKNGKTEEDKNKVKAGKANDGRENVKVDSESAETPTSPKGAETSKVKKDKDGEKKTDKVKDNEDEQTAVSDADTEEMDNNNTDNKDSSNKDNNNKEQKVPPLKLSVSGGCPVALTPTTTASTLYSVLMAPLDSRSTYTSPFAIDSADSGTRKRPRLDSLLGFGKTATESGKPLESQSTNAHSPVGMDLSKNRKRKLKKKKRKLVLNKVEVQRAKDFIYSSENEQFSVEKLRTMIEDVTEFLDAIWDVYCSEARRKNESVEEEGYKAAAVLKCLNASGEGSWGDLQLLSRAKSVLVLRSKNLAASTISRVENELGYETDIRNFIVRMLRFWMNEVVPKG